MSAALLQVSVNLAEINCGRCGGVYAINERYRQAKADIGGTWNCPYCQTGWGYAKGALAKEREAREAEAARHRDTLARLNEANAELAKAAKAAAAAKRRTAAGTCQCCNRTFKQLAAHMKNKHPEYLK